MNDSKPDAVTEEQLGLVSRLVRWVGCSVSWLVFLMIWVTFFVVVFRYAFNLSWIWLQDSIVYLHAGVFMLAAAWAWQLDEHVRVDIFYRDSSPRRKALVNVLGTLLFVIPFCVFLMVSSWKYVAISWSIQEGSREANGLPWVYLLKSLILAMPALMLLQAGGWLMDGWRQLRGNHT